MLKFFKSNNLIIIMLINFIFYFTGFFNKQYPLILFDMQSFQ